MAVGNVTKKGKVRPRGNTLVSMQPYVQTRADPCRGRHLQWPDERPVVNAQDPPTLVGDETGLQVGTLRPVCLCSQETLLCYQKMPYLSSEMTEWVVSWVPVSSAFL